MSETGWTLRDAFLWFGYFSLEPPSVGQWFSAPEDEGGRSLKDFYCPELLWEGPAVFRGDRGDRGESLWATHLAEIALGTEAVWIFVLLIPCHISCRAMSWARAVVCVHPHLSPRQSVLVSPLPGERLLPTWTNPWRPELELNLQPPLIAHNPILYWHQYKLMSG